MAKLSVHLVAWNGAKYIPYLFESLRKQTYKDWELLAIDNASTKDNTDDLIEKEIKNFPVPARLIRNKENNGFAGGHNQAIREACRPDPESREGEGSRDSRDGRDSSAMPQNDKPEYIQLLNQDMYLAPDYFEKVVAMMDSRPETGAGQGLLLRWDFRNMPTHNPSQPPLTLRGGKFGLTGVIDTMGLHVLRNRRVVDWRTRERMQNHNAPQPPLTLRGGVIEVFGVSGALPIYRRKAVEEVMFEGAMFDDEFGSYKEDVDLAFRLRGAGWKAFVEPSARAWHDRTAAGPRETSDHAALKNRKGRAAYVNYYSYRNHLVVLLKNEHRVNFAKDWPAILWYEFKKFAYLLCTDWATLKGLHDIKKMWPRIMQKRSAIMASYKVKANEMRKRYV